MALQPTQPPGPGPTDAPLPSYQSYSPYTTTIYTYTSTLTRVAYDPSGSLAPSLTEIVTSGVQSSTGYRVVNVPLLYDGPTPPPPLGTGWTLPGGGGGGGNGGESSTEGGSSGGSGTSGPAPTGGSGGGSSGGSNGNGNGGTGNSPSEGGGTSDGGTSPDGGGASNGNDGGGGGGAQDGGEGGNGSNGGSGSGSGQGGSSGSQNGGGTNTGQGQGQGSPEGGDNAGADGGGSSNSGGAGQGGESTGQNGGSTGNSNGNAGQNGGDGSAAQSGGDATAGGAPAPSDTVGAAPTNPNGGSNPSATGAPSNSLPSASDSLPIGSVPTVGGPTGTSSAPSPTVSAFGNPSNDHLSDGQIVGIAIGAIAAFLLLLLLLFCCARRRNRRAQDRAAGGAGAGTTTTHNIGRSFSNFGRQGRYAFLGAGAGAGAGGAAAAGGRGSLHSDEWEEDHLSGGDGSGFFVVGGRRTTGGSLGRNSRSGSMRSLRNMPSSSGSNGGRLAALGAGLGAGGIVAAALGRNKTKRKPVPQLESDDDDPFADGSVDPDAEILPGDGEMSERRGLMDFGSAEERYYAAIDPADNEMRQNRPLSWSAATMGALGAAAASADRDGRPEMSQSGSGGSTGAWASPQSDHGRSASQGGMSHRYSSSAGGGYTSGSVTGSGSGSGAASGSGAGRGTSSGSTGARTGSSLPPPPRAPRDRSSPTAAGNAASSPEHSPTNAIFSDLGQARPSMDTNNSSNSGLGLAVAAAAGAGGLTALAAAHRESHGSTYSKGYYPSDSSTEQLHQQQQQDRHSRFISHDTALLGPSASHAQSSDEEDSLAPMHTYGNLASGPHPVLGRLSTIRSVGDIGERGSSSERTPSSHGNSQLTAHAEAPQVPSVSPGVGPGRSGGFFTPTTSPRQYGHLSLRSAESGSYSEQHWRDSQAIDDVDDDGRDRADEQSFEREASVRSAGAGGLLGGVSAGWQRLTLNPYSWLPGSSRDSPAPGAGPHENDDGIIAQASDRDLSNRHVAQTSDHGLTSEARSERASVYGPSALGHASGGSQSISREVSQNSSRSPPSSQRAGAEFGVLSAAAGAAAAGAAGVHQNTNNSGSSGERAANTDGYIASISSESPSLRSRSSGVDSLSQHPHASSNGSGSSSISQASGSVRSRSTGASGASTGAASYSPSNMDRGGARSSRGRGGSYTSSSRAAYATGPSGAASLSGTSQSHTGSSDAQSSHATAGGSSGSPPVEGEDRQSSLQRLSSVSEREGDDGAYRLREEDDVFGSTPPQGHYPSTSLGAAMMRQAQRERQRESSASPEDLFGTTPTQGSGLQHAAEPSGGSSTHSWRESPRVSAISQRAERAAAAAAHLEQSRHDAFAQAQAGLQSPSREPSGGEAAIPIPIAPWESLEKTFAPAAGNVPIVPPSPRTASRLRNVQNEAELGEASGDEEDPDRTLQPESSTQRGTTFEWPKFLRF